jgi:hypothetical protein
LEGSSALPFKHCQEEYVFFIDHGRDSQSKLEIPYRMDLVHYRTCFSHKYLGFIDYLHIAFKRGRMHAHGLRVSILTGAERRVHLLLHEILLSIEKFLHLIKLSFSNSQLQLPGAQASGI